MPNVSVRWFQSVSLLVNKCSGSMLLCHISTLFYKHRDISFNLLLDYEMDKLWKKLQQSGHDDNTCDASKGVRGCVWFITMYVYI